MRIIPFALTIFLGAFLLFQVQPLIGRYILPWFGGAAGVWSVVMLFFQGVLLLGYAYAHFLSTRLGPRAQVVVHLVVLGLCAAMLPIVPPESFKPGPGDDPILGILGLLAVTVGAPYFALATTGPLLQAWFARAVPGRSPYPLYALGNAASLLALLGYPFVVERFWGRDAQAVGWSWAFGAFALSVAGAAVFAARARPPVEAKSEELPRVAWRTRLLWLALPAVASALLLSVTNQLCLDVASVPFLWVLPLSIYLLSFVLTFSRKAGPRRAVWYPLAGAAMAAVVVSMHSHTMLSLTQTIAVYSLALHVLCIVMHGEAYRLRPAASGLTGFYLYVAAGGVLGGLFAAVIAPLAFPMYLELHCSLLTCALLLGVCAWPDRRAVPAPLRALFPLAVLALAAGLAWHVQRKVADSILVTRNFYGVLTVSELDPKDGGKPLRALVSGTTRHGVQFMDLKYRRNRTAYYGVHSGAGIAANSLGRGPRRVGVVGLGVGTMAAYGREGAGDVVRFYEINERCTQAAREQFFYLADSYAKCEVIHGDARLSLEREPAQGFDLLVIDAFTSDAIPVHLLTLEAFELYLRHVGDGGGIAVHITNHHLDLAPVIRAAGVKLGLHMCEVRSAPDARYGADDARWVLLSRGTTFMDRVDTEMGKVRAALAPRDKDPEAYTRRVDMARVREVRLWTDDFSNLFEVLN